jgi:hypothetical protein
MGKIGGYDFRFYIVNISNNLVRFYTLLENCFWREGLEAAFGPDRMGEKGGYLV